MNPRAIADAYTHNPLAGLVTTWRNQRNGSRLQVHSECVFFVLHLERLGAVYLDSREGDPHGFEIRFTAPYAVARSIREGGSFTVEIIPAFAFNPGLTDAWRLSLVGHEACADSCVLSQEGWRQKDLEHRLHLCRQAWTFKFGQLTDEEIRRGAEAPLPAVGGGAAS